VQVSEAPGDGKTKASWQVDPTGRHEYRYWDGSKWTDDVADAGISSTDPIDAAAVDAAPADEIRGTETNGETYEGLQRAQVSPADWHGPSWSKWLIPTLALIAGAAIFCSLVYIRSSPPNPRNGYPSAVDSKELGVCIAADPLKGLSLISTKSAKDYCRCYIDQAESDLSYADYQSNLAANAQFHLYGTDWPTPSISSAWLGACAT